MAIKPISTALTRLLAGLLLLAGLATAAFPDKPVRMVIGYGPSSSTDLVSRLMAQGLSELWKQPVVVQNRAGAAANIAADMVAKSQADGYTLRFAQNGLAISVAALPGLPFNSLFARSPWPQ